jgi:hypothetical protein
MTSGNSPRGEADLLRRALAPTAECPPLDRLAAAALGDLPADEAAVLAAHAAGCAACGAELELARGIAAPVADADEQGRLEAVLARLTAGRAEGSGAPARVLAFERPQAARRGAGAPRSWTRWAAAALVLLAVALAARTMRPPLPPEVLPPGEGEVVRGGEIELEAPLGATAAIPAEFAWRPVAGAERYEVELLDVAGERLWSATTAAGRVELPEAARQLLRPRASYAWRVRALDAGGQEIGRSVVAPFTLGASE